MTRILDLFDSSDSTAINWLVCALHQIKNSIYMIFDKFAKELAMQLTSH